MNAALPIDDPAMHPLEAILRLCAQADPNPWYPSAYVQTTGTAREHLDPYLDQLRLGGLIRLTDWAPVTGQGYVLTPAGGQVLHDRRLLERLRKGQLPIPTNGPPVVDLRRIQGTRWHRGEAAREALVGPFSPPWVTLILIFINLLFFVAGLALASAMHVPINAYLAGADNAGEVHKVQDRIGFLNGKDVYLRGQWWRLLTSCFNHVGWIHLAVNMFSLLMVGPLLERMWGPGRYLTLYLLSGFGGSCGMLIENPLRGGAGASGALWGILASMIPWIFLHRQVLPPSLIADWRRRLVTVFILNIYITFAFSQISKGGHFGGGIVGLIAAVPLDSVRFGRQWKRWLASAALAAMPLICVEAVLVSFRSTGELIEQDELAGEAVRFYNDDVLPVLVQPLRPREPQEVQKLIGSVSAKVTALKQGIKRLQEEEPYWNPAVNSDRRRVEKNLQELLDRFDAALKKLRLDSFRQGIHQAGIESGRLPRPSKPA
jgi:membrane associated rhomboid family serine protease